MNAIHNKITKMMNNRIQEKTGFFYEYEVF